MPNEATFSTRCGDRKPVPTQGRFQLTKSIRIVRLWRTIHFPACTSYSGFPGILHRGTFASHSLRRRISPNKMRILPCVISAMLRLPRVLSRNLACSSVKCLFFFIAYCISLICLDYIFFLHYILSKRCSICLSWICSCSQSCADINLGKNKMVAFGAEDCVELLFCHSMNYSGINRRIDKELDW